MKYLVLLAHEPGMWTEADEATFAAYHQGHVDFARAVGAHNHVAQEAVAGALVVRLHPGGGHPTAHGG